MPEDGNEQRSAKRKRALGLAVALVAAFLLGAAAATAVLLARAPEPTIASPGVLPEPAPQRDPDEKPFYTVDKRTLGPLTMEELQVNIPRKIDRQLTDPQRQCFFENVARLVQEAGDPETLDPADVAFLPTDGSWDELTFYGRRGLLAQALISRAVTLCF